jgi:hypothetical protein
VFEMKKNVKNWLVLVFVFIVGFCFGIFAYANRDALVFWDNPLCLDGGEPDKHGCCEGEVYTNMGDLGFNCCPESGGDCFPPMR